MSEFKDIIVKLRNEKGFTQGQMADALGTSKSTVGMWEMGERFPSKELYEAIADYFNVDMDYLYGRSDIRKKVHFDEDGTAYTPASNDLDIRRLERARTKMPEDDWQFLMSMVTRSFSEYFEDDGSDDPD